MRTLDLAALQRTLRMSENGLQTQALGGKLGLMESLQTHLYPAVGMLSDPWKVCGLGLMVYLIVATATLSVRSSVQQTKGFRTLTPPLGGLMLLPISLVLFPILGFGGIASAIYFLTKFANFHSLTSQEWTLLTVFVVIFPICVHCPISFFRWCVVRRRYDETKFEWGIIRFSNRIDWEGVASYRLGEYRGLELRLRDGEKVAIPASLNGLPELAQLVSERLTVAQA